MSTETTVKSETPSDGKSRWGVFAYPVFTVILVASSISNVGIAMFDTATSWLMTSLNPDPLMVSAVQVATTLPMFLLTLPAGVLTDIVDPRRLLIGAQVAVLGISIAFAAIVALHLATPSALLTTTFLLGVAGALAAPAWLLITPMLAPTKEDLDSVIAINNTSYNVSRAVGPALGGLIISALSIEVPFWCYCVGNLAVLAALIWWRCPCRSKETLPTERFFSALKAGIRYVRYNRDIDSTLARAIAFYLFASAPWALLPLVARDQMHNGAAIYGVLLGMIGLGSILGSLTLNWLKQRLGPDRLAALATAGTIAALVLYGMAHGLILAIGASFLTGACWIIMMTTLFVSAQVALPDWVRGRGLAIYLSFYFGAMTAGSAIWGKVASVEGLSTTFFIAAAGAAVGLIVTWRRKLQTAASLDLSPANHWRAPVFVQRVDDDQGPILITVEYWIDPNDRAAFLAAMREIGLERKRDGAYAWNVFDDAAAPGRVIEVFLVQSLLELRRLRARVTHADRKFEEQAHRYLKEPLKASFLVAPQRHREKRRRLPASSAAPVSAPAE